MSAAVIAAVLAKHYATGGWAPRGGIPGVRGHWGCSCGAGGDVPNGSRVVACHRTHIAEAIVTALDTT